MDSDSLRSDEAGVQLHLDDADTGLHRKAAQAMTGYRQRKVTEELVNVLMELTSMLR